MNKTQMYTLLVTVITMAAAIIIINIFMETKIHADEAECFSKTRDIRCYKDNRWEKSR